MTEYVYNYKKHGILKKCPYPENFCDGTPIPCNAEPGTVAHRKPPCEHYVDGKCTMAGIGNIGKMNYRNRKGD